MACFLLLSLLGFTAPRLAGAASFYTQKLDDPRAVYLSPSTNGDDTALLQQAINRVQESNHLGVVFLGPGRYRLRDTVYIWPGIRLIGYGAERPELILPARTPGYNDPEHEKLMIFFAGGRPGFGRNGRRRARAGQGVPDANPGTFYSAIANLDFRIEEGNGGAVAVRAHYAQHCFLAHVDFHLGTALAGIHEGGNVLEDVHFEGGMQGIWTSKPSPGWQFTLVDCSFTGQRRAAIREHEAGLTLIRPQFRNVPTAVEIETNFPDELWVSDAWLENVSGPAFIYNATQNPRMEITMENVTCRNVTGFGGLAGNYTITQFSHGLHYDDLASPGKFRDVLRASRRTRPQPAPSDIPPLPPCETWVNARDLGAKGDGTTDDTEALQTAIRGHRAVYLPSGFYIVHDTLALRPDSVLIGLHPGATQIILPDGAPAFAGLGPPKPLLETPPGGSNIVIGIGLYTSGDNPRAVAALWKAGARSLMNDVRFLGGHGTPLPDGSRANPYNETHTADPDPNRHWDSQYPSLWVADGGGGTFLDIWTPSTFAQAGLRVSDTETPGRVYELSSEHHVRNEIQVRRAAHWQFDAIQTEEERGESGFALPIEIDSCHDLTFANFHAYRVISSFQPFPTGVRVTGSRDIHFRNVHCDSNSKVNFDSTVTEPNRALDLRAHEFAWLDISGRGAPRRDDRVKKLADGFYNISGGAAAPNGDFYFIDVHWQRIYRWREAHRSVEVMDDSPLQPVNLAVDASGGVIVVSGEGQGEVYALPAGGGACVPLHPEKVTSRPRGQLYLPMSDWHLNRESLSQPAAQFSLPDGAAVLPVGEDFLEGAVSWGVPSSPPMRSFGLAPAAPGNPFYVTDESALQTWRATVRPDGSLENFQLFAEQGGESVAVDRRGRVYVAAGEIYVYNPAGRLIDTIWTPARPIQLVFGGKDGRTLFIAARSALYAVRVP